MRTTLKIIYTASIVLILALGTLLAFTVLPIPGGLDARVVQSGSMEPAISTGSLIFIRSAEQYSEGDIITFRRNDRETPTTHRVIKVREEDGETFFVTKGDANTSQDMEEVSESAVLGSVRLTVPFVGYVIDFARQPIGFLLIVIIPAVAIGTDEVRKILREIRRMRPEKNAENAVSEQTEERI